MGHRFQFGLSLEVLLLRASVEVLLHWVPVPVWAFFEVLLLRACTGILKKRPCKPQGVQGDPEDLPREPKGTEMVPKGRPKHSKKHPPNDTRNGAENEAKIGDLISRK